MTKNSLFFNGCFDKNRIKSLISWSLKNCGEKITIDLVENLKTLGFAYATEAGISLGIDDLKIPPTKAKLISEADVKIKLTQINYKQGYLTGIEKFQQLIDTWHRTSEILKQNVIQYFRSTDILNPVYMMAFSGARGNISQVRQLVGMRGLMSDPQGQILDFPIKSNFREGLTLTEYIISCYGARKGLVDTALKTANSGYLTRRLVDVSHHIIISDFDCKTQHGIVLNAITENQKIIVPLQKRLIGRILAGNIYSKSQTTRRVVSPISLENPSTSNITTKISNVSKIKQKLVFTKPLLNTNSLQSQMLFPTKKISNLGYVNFQQKSNNGRALALFSQLILYGLSKKWSFGLHKNKNNNKNNFYELWNSNNKNTEEFLVAKKERDFYWQQLVFFLSHVTLAFSNQTLIASKNEEISVSLAVKIATLKKQVLVRSPLTCEIKNSLCQLCYGWSLAHGKLVSLGEAVGIIAAQSIGEPGTQLTMRTFHTGGVFSGDIMSEIRAPFSGIVEFPEFFQGVLIRTPHGKIAFLTKVPGNFQILSKKNLQFNLPEKTQLSNIEIDTKHHENKIKTIKTVTFEIPAFTVLFVRNQEHVIKTQLIAEFSSISANRNQRIQANHDLNAELEGEVYFKNVIVHTQIKKEEILNRTTYNLGSIWIFSGKIYQQPVSFTLFPQSGDLVNLNSIMGQYSSMSPYNGVLNILPNASKKISCEATNELSKYLKMEQNEKFVSDGLLSKGKRKSYNTLQNKKAKIEPVEKKSTSFFPAPLASSEASSNFYKINPLTNNTPFLNHPLISFAIKSIQYKKIGYFLSFSNAQKSLISLDRFFLSNSLKQNFKNSTKLKTNFYFQSFPKQYQTETGGILICDNFYINEKLGCGEVFWIYEETYTFSSCNFICFHFKPASSIKNQDFYSNNNPTLGEVTSLLKGTSRQVGTFKKQTNYKKWVTKNNSLIFYTNSQGKISRFCSKLNGYIQSYSNYALPHNKKTQFGTPISWQPRVQTQQKKLQLSLSLVAQKKANKIQSTFFAYNFFDNQEFDKTKFGSKIFSKSNLENKKSNTFNFRLNPLSFYNAKYKKLYFALFKTTRSSILKPKFAWETNKEQCNLRTKSKFSKHYFSNISPSKLNKNTTSINLLKIKSFNSQPSKYKDIKFPLLPLHYNARGNAKGSVKPHPEWENKLNFSYFGNNLSKTSQSFFQRKKLCLLNKKNKFKLKIKPGWVYFPTNINQTIPKQKSVIQPGVVCFDDILFDQYSVYFECFSFNKFYNQNLSQIDSLQFQIKVEKNTNLKYTLDFQFICNQFTLSKNNKVFTNAILTKPNIYSFFSNVHSSQFFSKNFSTFIFSNRKETLRNKKLLLNNFIKKNVFSPCFRKDKKKFFNYEKIYFLQTFNFSRKPDRNVLNNFVLPILMSSKNIFFFQLLVKQIPEYNEKQFTRIKTKFIPKFFVLIRKIHSYSFISSVKYKALLSQQNQHGLHSLITQNKSAKAKIHFIYFSWFNQQKITQLFFNSLSPSFSIKPYFPYKGYRKSVFLKNTIILKFFLLFIIPKHYAFNIVQIKFISKTENNKLQCQSPTFSYTANSRFKKNKVLKNIDFLINQRNRLIFNLTWYLNFSILRELKFSNQLNANKFNTKLEKNTLLVYSKNAISLQTPISFTTFFSPFQGEILKPQAESIEKLNENYLILTDKDQVTFSLNYFPLRLAPLGTLFSESEETIFSEAEGVRFNRTLYVSNQNKQGEEEIIRFDKSTQIIKDSNNKKIVVANLKPPSPNFLGNFIGYGTKILENLAIPESGQIIQIHKSKIVVRKVQSILFSRKGILSVYNGGIIEKNSLVLSLFYQRLKTGDIVQGIPKIEQLFEARKTNQGEILAGSLHEKLESIFKYYKKKYNPEIAASFSLTKIQQIIVNNVQQVYQSQGVTIAEKHLEIIVRQMTSKVQIIKSGETNLLRGEIVDLDWIKMINKGIRVEKAQYKPVILGITKKSLETKSFISEASFQETTRILAKAATQRKTDFLKGLKENVILGHVIPAGTGFSFSSGKILNTNQLKPFHTNKTPSFDIFGDIFSKIST